MRIRALFAVSLLFAFVACHLDETPRERAQAQRPSPPPTPTRSDVATPLERATVEAWDRGDGEHFARVSLTFRNTDGVPHAVNAQTLRGLAGESFLVANEAGSAFAEGPVAPGATRTGRVYLYNMQRAFPRPTRVRITFQDGAYGPFDLDVPVTVLRTDVEVTFDAASARLAREFVERPSPMHAGETWVFRVHALVHNPGPEKRKFVQAFRIEGSTEDVGSLILGRRDQREPDDVLAPGERIVVPLVFGVRGDAPRPSEITVLYAPDYARPRLTRTFAIPPR